MKSKAYDTRTSERFANQNRIVHFFMVNPIMNLRRTSSRMAWFMDHRTLDQFYKAVSDSETKNDNVGLRRRRNCRYRLS